MRGNSWCVVQITDLNKHLAFRAGGCPPSVGDLIKQARAWVKERRQEEPDYPVPDECWAALTVCSDFIKETVWGAMTCFLL